MYLMQETTHQGPVIDLRYNLHSHRIVSIRCGSAQLWNFNRGSKPTPNYTIVHPFHILFHRESKLNEPSINYIQFNGDQYQFWEDGASLLICILESHMVSAPFFFYQLSKVDLVSQQWMFQHWTLVIKVVQADTNSHVSPFYNDPLTYVHAYQCTALILIGKIIISP